MHLKVKVIPESKKEKVVRLSEDKLLMEIREKPLRGEANKKVKEVLSFLFPQKRIKLIKGQSSRNKIFKIYD